MDLVKKVKNKNIKSGHVSVTGDELISILSEPSTLQAKTYGGRVLCKKKPITKAMIEAAIQNKIIVGNTSRCYYLMPYK